MALSLASIQRGAQPKPPITVLHGSPGVGKTTWAAGAHKPIFVRTEDGLGVLSVDTFPVSDTWESVVEAMGVLYREEHDYKTLVIDSLSALEPMIWAAVAKAGNKENIEDFGYGKGFVMALDYWQQFVQGIIALRDQRNIMPILIAHSEVTRFDSPEVEPFDRYQIKLHKRAFHLLYERADIIGFANWETKVVKDDVGFNQKQRRGIGTGQRLLHLSERPAFIAKNRYSLPETMPLDWETFNEALTSAMQANHASEA